MKKLILVLMAILVFAVCFGCGKDSDGGLMNENSASQKEKCQHSWIGATCTSAPVCTLCGTTQPEGQALGHKWEDATCEEPKTCNVCGSTQGKAAGHNWNIESATCTQDKVCNTCKKIDANATGHLEVSAATCTKASVCKACQEAVAPALEHIWEDATCDKAKTCSVCKKKDGNALGHNYVKNVCTVCSDKMIETYSELESYLSKNYKTLKTKIGDINYITFEIVENDPNWGNYNFEVQIETELYCDDLNHSLDYSIFYGDFLAYEDRIQAAADIINYQAEIVEICQEAFPNQKFELKFYTWGYEYPNIKVGFNSTSKLIWRNWKYNNSGLSGSLGTDLVEMTIFPIDFMSYYRSNYDKWESMWADICELCPQYNIDW